MGQTDLTTVTSTAAGRGRGRKYPKSRFPLTNLPFQFGKERYFILSFFLACLHVGQRHGDGGLLGGRGEELLEGVLRDLVLWPDLESVEGDPLRHGVDGEPLLRDLLAQPPHLVVPPLAQLQYFISNLSQLHSGSRPSLRASERASERASGIL